MSSQLDSSVGRILAQDGTMAGCGLLVDGKRILTSTEVVARALGLQSVTQDMPEGKVQLDFPVIAPNKILGARVVHWQPAYPGATGTAESGQNIAVLELEESLPKREEDKRVIPAPTGGHYSTVINAIKYGELVPFFGAGVNLCGRPERTGWRRGQHLPSGSELADYLAREFNYPLPDTRDLVRVSQYIALMSGHGSLNNRLRHVFNADYPPTSLHRFFARLPSVLREKGYPPYQLIVTTNYDDVLERAFKEENEPYDLVTYQAAGDNEQRGKFLHWLPDGSVRLIDKPNEYELPLDSEDNLQRSAILKIHGAVDRITQRPDKPRDSFVITEDHYIDYLTRSDISSLVPITLAAKLQSSHFLFLGYSLRDWNLRVILHRIWMEQQHKANYMSWAIQLSPEELEQKYWTRRDVEIYNARLEDYIAQLSRGIHNLPPAGGDQ